MQLGQRRSRDDLLRVCVAQAELSKQAERAAEAALSRAREREVVLASRLEQALAQVEQAQIEADGRDKRVAQQLTGALKTVDALSSAQPADEVTSMFNLLDVNGVGQLSFEDFAQMCGKRVSSDTAQRIFRTIDANLSGFVEPEEFRRGYLYLQEALRGGLGAAAAASGDRTTEQGARI